MATETGPSLRIGELSRRVGVSPELLRAWERRYGLLEPGRTDGGLRLYSAEDVRRVRAMQAHLQSGLSAAEAARLARSDEGAAAEPADQPALQRRGRAACGARRRWTRRARTSSSTACSAGTRSKPSSCR